MSTWKTEPRDNVESPEKDALKGTKNTGEAPSKSASVELLEIDVEADAGGDPYNRTGHFCVPVFDKRDK